MDFALVTIKISKWNRQYDMELPAKMVIGNVISKIIEALKLYDPSLSWDFTNAEIRWGEKLLNHGMTLSDYQIWDGEILELIF